MIIDNLSLLTIYKSYIRAHLDYGKLSIIKHIVCLFNKNKKAFSTMQPQPLQELYVEYPKRSSSKSWAWSLCNTRDGTESYAAFIKF